MALYPSPPGHRMAYDIDGSGLYHYRKSTGLISRIADSWLTGRNSDEEHTRYGDFSMYDDDFFAVAFPEKRDLTGIFFSLLREVNNYPAEDISHVKRVEVSENTQTLIDGDWTTILTPAETAGDVAVTPDYRTKILELSASNVRAIRIVFGRRAGSTRQRTSYLKVLHLYGSISEGQTLDKLAIWHPTDDVPIDAGYFDWGDIAQGSVSTRQFRVKNLSSTKTAKAIDITKSATGEAAQSLLAYHKFSVDTQQNLDTVRLSQVAPGATSQIVTMSINLPSTAPLGPKTVRVQAKPTEWM